MTDSENVKGVARLTGLAYLALALGGAVGFMFVRAKLYVPGNAATTMANLVEHPALARLGIAADLLVVLAQAVVALCFFRLFRAFDSLAAGAVAAFGLVNAVAVLVGMMFSTTSLAVALAASTPTGSAAETALLLYDLSGAAWSVGGLFFGLWLIPMGWLAWRSGRMPRILGWLLIAGGLGYIASTFLRYVLPAASAFADALTLPATAGEFWMIGYLLAVGVRNNVKPTARAEAGRGAAVAADV